MSTGGAIQDFDEIRFGGPTVPDESVVAVGTTPTRVLKNDPDRLSITMTNISLNELRWSIRSNVAATEGQILGAGQTVVLQVQNDGATCGVDLWALFPAGAGNVNILTLRRQSRTR